MPGFTNTDGDTMIDGLNGWLAQPVRAPALHAGGRRFESCTAHHIFRPDHGRFPATIPTWLAGPFAIAVEVQLLAAGSVNENIRYEPEDNPPAPVAIGVGFQAAALTLAPVAITVVIVSRIAGQPDGYISWAVFAALLVSGITTIIQAVRLWRIGAGHVLLMGTSGAFIAVCVAALVQGGPALMASLIVLSSLFQFLMAARLSLLRRIFTPVVTGTVIMLIAATVMPIVFDTLDDVPEGTATAAAPVAALVTIVVVAALVLRGAAVAAIVVSPNWDRAWLRRGRALRDVRCSDSAGRALGRSSLRLLAGVRVHPWRGVLGAFAGLRHGHPCGSHRNHRRRRSYPAGFPPQAEGHRLPGSAGRAQRRRRRQPVLRSVGDCAPTPPIPPA